MSIPTCSPVCLKHCIFYDGHEMTKPEVSVRFVLCPWGCGCLGDKCTGEAIQGHHYEFVLGDFLGGPVDKTSPFNAGGAGSIHGRGANIPHAVGCSQNFFKKKSLYLIYWHQRFLNFYLIFSNILVLPLCFCLSAGFMKLCLPISLAKKKKKSPQVLVWKSVHLSLVAN